ncbi:(2Fe-2S)-binding protein [Rhodocyclus purpureus]|uniref:(2Fe-2S)-binding protein n=1 Tax=Rhodocyclus purpureus TaxID=1067 RepID=UPI00191298EC|nr:(2Fe-2S)-binding protein [Rhodocyclus purpureus]MBK5915351.1 (2Fe-2S)-binding protein [Rhodocyclus purpureus]
MYVCVCKAVTERNIREAALAGARRLKDLRRELGVTSDCGLCAASAQACLREARKAGAPVQSTPTHSAQGDCH